MTFQNQIPVSLTYRVREKLNQLTQKERSRFLSKIRRIINGQACAKQLKQLNASVKYTLFRIRYNLNKRIIAAIVKSQGEQKQLRILDFVCHDDMDRGLFSCDDSNFEVVDINQLAAELVNNNGSELSTESVFSEDPIKITAEDFESKQDDFWLYVVDPEAQDDPDLLLSSEQNDIAQTELPILLTGSAGSGKTTIAVYNALHKSYLNPEAQILYITYSAELKKYAQNIAKKSYSQELKNLVFWDYTSLAKALGKRYKIIQNNEFIGSNQVTQQKFIEQFCQKRKIERVDPISLWQEIRHLIKGTALATETDNGLIEHENYLELTHQSTLPGNADYSFIYSLAHQYQHWLDNRGYWDEIDLTYKILKGLSNNFTGIYDIIYCDEIQDLTEIQIKFLLTLLKHKNNIVPSFFFTGDPAQIINPSGFSWKKIKSLIYYSYKDLPDWKNLKGSIEPKELKVNFRSLASIVNLGEQILTVAAKENDNLSEYPHQKAILLSEEKPLLITGDEDQIIGNHEDFGARNAIIVTNEEEKEELVRIFSRKGIKCERILTIQEVKGLEFDQVLVWKFFTHFENWNWRRNSTIKELEKFKYNCLYVCTTRARNRLYFYDEKISSFWQLPEVKEYVLEADETALTSFFQAGQSKEELLQSAEEYENQGAFKLAIELYKLAGEQKLAKRAEARKEEQAANWEEAGDIWDSIDEWEEAYNCWLEVNEQIWMEKWANLNRENYRLRGEYFEEKKNYDLAYYCYEKAEDKIGEIRCLEKTNQWEVAGDKYKELGNEAKAQEAYLIAEEHYKQIKEPSSAVKMWTRLQEWEKLALISEKLKSWQEAGRAWEKINQTEKAATCYEKANCWSQAENCWREVGNQEKIALACERQSKWVSAAEIWQQLANHPRLARVYEQLNNWIGAAEIWENLAAWEKAAKAWANNEETEKAAICYEKANLWAEAESLWEMRKNWQRVALACEAQEKWQSAALSWEKLKKWQPAAIAWANNQEIEKAAICYEKAKNWSQAEACWLKLNNSERVAIACERQEKWADAALSWEAAKTWKKAALAWNKIKEKEKAAICYEKANRWAEAESCWRKVENWEKVAIACQNQGKWQQAAEIWLQLNQIDKAAECFEKGKIWPEAEKYWAEVGVWERVAVACEFQGKWVEAAQLWSKVNILKNAAECYEKANMWIEAESCWHSLNHVFKVGVVCEYQNKWEEAAGIWEKMEFWLRAANAWMEINEIEKAAICYEKNYFWPEAEACWRKVSNWEKVAVACEHQGKWLEATIAWFAIQELEKASKCYDLSYRKGQYWTEAEAC